MKQFCFDIAAGFVIGLFVTVAGAAVALVI